jgi:hypothetical protein
MPVPFDFPTETLAVENLQPMSGPSSHFLSYFLVSFLSYNSGFIFVFFLLEISYIQLQMAIDLIWRCVKFKNREIKVRIGDCGINSGKSAKFQGNSKMPEKQRMPLFRKNSSNTHSPHFRHSFHSVHETTIHIQSNCKIKCMKMKPSRNSQNKRHRKSKKKRHKIDTNNTKTKWVSPYSF